MARLRARDHGLVHARGGSDPDGGALLAAIACVAAALLLYGITLLVMGASDDDEPLSLASRRSIAVAGSPPYFAPIVIFGFSGCGR